MNPIDRQPKAVYWHDKYRCWCVTDYDVAKRLLKDSRMSASTAQLLQTATFPAAARQSIAPLVDVLSSWLIFSDPIYHTKLRRMLNPYFSTSAVDSMRGEIKKIIQLLIGNTHAEYDFIKEVDKPLPALILGSMIGLNQDESLQMSVWHQDMAPCIDELIRGPAVVDRAVQSLAAMKVFLNQHIDHIVENKINGFVLDFYHAIKSEQILPVNDVWMILFMLFSTGTETTTSLLSGSVFTILNNLDCWNSLNLYPDNVGMIIEERLRFESPVQSVLRRANRKVAIHDAVINVGDYVRIFVGDANRDAQQFECPHAFNFEREKNPHLAFGYGIHFCLGRHLAKAICEELLLLLRKECPNMILKTKDPEYQQGITLLSLKHLLVA